MTPKQRELAGRVKFCQTYDGGPINCRKAKRVGARRCKKALSKSRRVEDKEILQTDS